MSNTAFPDAAASSPRASPWWGRIETIWLLLPTLCALMYALCQPLAPNDLWYHVRAGEFLARFGRVPTQNGMSSALPLAAPYYYQSWLAEGALFQTLRIGGLSGLQLLRALCLGGAWGLVSLATFRGLRRVEMPSLPAARIVALTTVYGFLMASNNMDLRPQTFSVLFFGAWLLALGEFFAARTARQATVWGSVLLLLVTLWANTHGAFVVALVSLGAWTLGVALSRDAAGAKRGVLVWGGCLLAVGLNPHGFKIYPYLKDLATDPISQKYIQEWQSPRFDEWHNAMFLLSGPLLLGLVAFAWRGSRGKTRRAMLALLPLTLVLGALWVMGLRNMRSVTWFALACPLSLATVFALLTRRGAAPSATEAPPITRVGAILNAFMLLLLCALPVALLPGVKAQWPWPESFRAQFAPTPPRLFPSDPPLLLERTTPVEAVEFLVHHPPRHRVFTDMVSGSYMTWASYPDVPPLCDPRIELFKASFWEKDYQEMMSGPRDAAARLETRRFSDVLLDVSLDEPLAKRLRATKNWKVVARGGKTLLFRFFSTGNSRAR